MSSITSLISAGGGGGGADSHIVTDPKKLSADHWAYNGQLILRVLNKYDIMIRDVDIDLLEFVYRSAMEHGYKHGVDDAEWDKRGKDES